MTGKHLLVLAILIAAGIGAAVYFTQANGQSAPQEPGTPMERPEGAILLEGEFTPTGIVRSIVGVKPGDAAAAETAYNGVWSPQSGWDGDVTKVRQNAVGSKVWMIVSEITLPGSVQIVVDAPGELREIREGDNLRFSGRIVSVEPSTNIMVIPHRITMDNVTVDMIRR